MKMICTPALAEHMRKKNRMNLVVDVASANTSDFEVTEIFLRLADDRHAAYLKKAKKFRAVPWEEGEILLPNYHLVYDEEVIFDLKKTWIFRRLSQKGIRL